MNGSELKELVDFHGLTQKQAAEEFGVDPVTICRNIAKGTKEINRELSKSAIGYSLAVAQREAARAVGRTTDLINRLMAGVV